MAATYEVTPVRAHKLVYPVLKDQGRQASRTRINDDGNYQRSQDSSNRILAVAGYSMGWTDDHAGLLNAEGQNTNGSPLFAVHYRPGIHQIARPWSERHRLCNVGLQHAPLAQL